MWMLNCLLLIFYILQDGHDMKISNLFSKNLKIVKKSNNFLILQIGPFKISKFTNWSLFFIFKIWSESFKIYENDPTNLTMNHFNTPFK